MRKFVFLWIATCFVLPLFSQGVLISPNPGNPNPAAGLDVDFTNKGFLLPRLTTAQRNAIVAPPAGLQVYNTTTKCLEIFLTGSGWQSIICDCPNPPPFSIAGPGSVGINQSVSFTATGGLASYSWTFPSGSPSSSTAQNPSVSWANPGTYQVVCVGTDNTGCSNADTISVVVTNCASGTQNFSFTGSQQIFVVPGCVTSVNITANGAQGNSGSQGYLNGSQGGNGGAGGQASGTLTVTPGETLYVYVGGQNGYNGGGNGGTLPGAPGGNGGGGSDVRRGGITVNHRVIVAGGGGGGGGGAMTGSCSPGCPGAGGNGASGGSSSAGANGTTGCSGPGAGSGGQSGVSGGSGGAGGSGNQSGQTGGTGNATAGGNGGNATHPVPPYSNNATGSGGGGGGGYIGGGGGGAAGYNGGCGGSGGAGGGGSNYIGGVTNGISTVGGITGNGSVSISW